MHQYALQNKGYTIHSPCQFGWYKNGVNDKSIHVPGGLQCIQTLDGYIIPLSINDCLAPLAIWPCTDHEWDNLPHVILTSELEWDPSVLDHEYKEDEQWGDVPNINTSFDEVGDYRHRVIVQHLAYFQRQDGDHVDGAIDQCVFVCQTSQASEEPLYYDACETELDLPPPGDPLPVSIPSTPKVLVKHDPNFDQPRPFFGWLSTDIIKKTFENTTQYARLPGGTLLKKSFKSPNPALNVYHRQEDVACDIAVIFVGVTSQVSDVYGIKTDRQFVNMLEDIPNLLARPLMAHQLMGSPLNHIPLSFSTLDTLQDAPSFWISRKMVNNS
jgi:hypothetical protein